MPTMPTFLPGPAFQWRSGEFGPDGSALPPRLRDFVRHAGATSEVTVYERTRPNGVVLEIRSAPLPNGVSLSGRRNWSSGRSRP